MKKPNILDDLYRFMIQLCVGLFGFVVLCAAIAQRIGPNGLDLVLMTVSVCAYFYREHGNVRPHKSQPQASLERERLDVVSHVSAQDEGEGQ